MITFTKEQLQQIEAAAKEVMWPVVWSEKKAREHFSEKITPKVVLKLARIALASLEAEPAIHRWRRVTSEPYGPYPWHYGNFIGFSKPVEGIEDEYFYSAPPAPVFVPAAMEMDDDFDSSFEHGKAVGWNAYRAAMLQGADGTLTNEGTIPVTQFKPVADLYGLTSPTGGETSFTFDAVEARDFIDGGWLCQEYVELERFQEAITNHTEDKLAMVDHSGDSNNMIESVTTACELRDAVDAIRNSGIAIDGEKILAERDALNSPVIPDGWVACSEQMPEDEQEVIVQNKMGYRYVSYFDEHSGLFFDMRGGNQMNCIEHIFVTHWMPMPAAPQQEA